MATLPNVFSPRPAPNPSRAIASVSNADAVGNALQGFGNEMNVVGLQAIDREATAAAKEADAAASERIRQLLYDPENGFANLSGRNAVAARGSALQQLDALPDSLMAGLSKPAQKKARDAVLARIERAKQTIDTHVSSERRTWINGASAARVESAYQDSLLNPAETENSLRIIESEILGTAAREGWSSEQTDLKLTQERSRVYRDQALRIAAVDPSQAAAFLAANRDKMLGSDVNDLEFKLIPLAKQHEGRKLGAAVANGGGLPSYDHQTKIEFSMGPARPNPPSKPILDVVGKSAQDVFGVGARVVITSGKENEGQQHGSNRHGTGLAADIAIYRPDGSRVKASDPDMAKFARAAAQNGAIGIGFGDEYMGGEHIHVDLVEPGPGQANTWASGGTAMRGEIVGIIGNRRKAGNMTAEDILAIPDPIVRAAAFDELNLVSSVRDGERKAALSAATDSAFQLIESGGRIDDLPLDTRTALGQDNMTSLRAYERSVASGVPVETDPAIYMMLKQMEASEPERFRLINPLSYASALSRADMKQIIDAQNKPRNRANEVAASTLMSVAANQMQAVGIDTKPSASEANKQKVATIQTQLLKWQDGVIEKTGEPPTASQIDAKVGQLLTPVVINPPGMFNEADGFAFEAGGFDVDANGLASGTITIGGDVIPPAVVQEQIEAMRATGQDISAASVVSRIIELMGR